MQAVSLIYAGRIIISQGLFVPDNTSLPEKRGRLVEIVPSPVGQKAFKEEELTPLRLQFCGEFFPKGYFLYSPEFQQHLDDLHRDKGITRMWRGGTKRDDLTVSIKDTCALT